MLSYHSIYENACKAQKTNFLIMFFWFKYIFPFKFKIRVLDLMLLPKNSVSFEGLYYSSPVNLLETFHEPRLLKSSAAKAQGRVDPHSRRSVFE